MTLANFDSSAGVTGCEVEQDIYVDGTLGGRYTISTAFDSRLATGYTCSEVNPNVFP